MNSSSFSGVCGRLRSSGVAGQPDIDRVCAFLAGRFQGQPILVEQVVAASGTGTKTALRILDAIVDDDIEDLLERRDGYRCPTCGTLEDGDAVRSARENGEPARCTEDGVDLADPDIAAEVIRVYYLL